MVRTRANRQAVDTKDKNNGPKGQNAPRGGDQKKGAPAAAPSAAAAAAAAASPAGNCGPRAEKPAFVKGTKEYALDRVAFFTKRAAESRRLIGFHQRHLAKDIDTIAHWKREAAKLPSEEEGLVMIEGLVAARMAEQDAAMAIDRPQQ